MFRHREQREREIALYVHIPFCRQRCAYCDFNAYADPGLAVRERYQRALLRDIEQAAREPSRLRSIYLGGGTPSICPAAWIKELLAACRDYFIWDCDIEVSIEANPGTVSLQDMIVWREAGINRVSFGVQSLDERILRLIGRIHARQHVFDSVRWAREAGFDNISLDLIYGLPTQTAAIMRSTLNEIVDLEPEHISVYELSVEEGTPLARALESGQYELPDEDEEDDIESAILDILAARGYDHYEISNWAKPGCACIHNEIYWANEEYLGLGCGAVSYINGWRYPRVLSPHLYADMVEAGQLPVQSGERLERERWKETLILGLRRAQGIDLRELAERYGLPLDDLSERWEQIPVELRRTEDGRVGLTQAGWDVSNEIFVRYLL